MHLCGNTLTFDGQAIKAASKTDYLAKLCKQRLFYLVDSDVQDLRVY